MSDRIIIFATALILTVAQVRADSAPHAAFTVTPPHTARLAMVTFDASASTAGAADAEIVRYDWDFNYRGEPFITRRTGAIVTAFFPLYRTYTVALRVTDSNGAMALASTALRVDVGNTAPVACAGGPYCPPVLAELTLDARASNDAQTPFGDTLAFAWDLDGDGQFDDAFGACPTLAWPALRALGLTNDTPHPLAVRVTDAFGLSDTATTTLTWGNDVQIGAWRFTFQVAFGSEIELTIGTAPRPAAAVADLNVTATNAGAPLADGTCTVLYNSSDDVPRQCAIQAADADGDGQVDAGAAWVLEITAGAQTPAFLLWDPGKVPASGLWLIEMAPGPANTAPAADGAPAPDGLRLDLSKAADLTVAAGQTKYFRLVCGVRQQILHLAAGWNQFSLPLEPLITEPSQLFADTPEYVLNSLAAWNPIAGGYDFPDHLHTRCGYWAYFTAPATVSVRGVAVAETGYPLPMGSVWYLVGIAVPVTLAANPDLFLPGYSWNPAIGLYEMLLPGDEMQSGLAYWFYALRPTILNLDPANPF